MFTIISGYSEYTFEFFYSRRKTIVIIRDGTGDLVSCGEATLSPKDKPIKSKGQKIALTRALETFHKDFRTAAWLAYRQVYKGLFIEEKMREVKRSSDSQKTMNSYYLITNSSSTGGGYKTGEMYVKNNY